MEVNQNALGLDLWNRDFFQGYVQCSRPKCRTHTHSVDAMWVGLDRRNTESFRDSSAPIRHLSDLTLLLPDIPSLTVGGEYGPLFRLLTEKGGQLRLQRLEVQHITRPSSSILPLLATQNHLKQLEGLIFKSGQAITIADTFLPELESLSTRSPSVVSALVPGRPIADLSVCGLAAAPSVLVALQHSRGQSLKLFVDHETERPLQYQSAIITALGSLPMSVKSLSFKSGVFGAESYLGLEVLIDLEEFCFWSYRSPNESLEGWLKGLPLSLRRVSIMEGNQTCTRLDDGYVLPSTMCCCVHSRSQLLLIILARGIFQTTHEEAVGGVARCSGLDSTGLYCT